MTDWPSTTSAAAAAIGLGFSGWQVLQLRNDRQEERLLGTQGVCVSWHPPIRPNKSDVDSDGYALWRYVFRVDNPGQFPISDVRVRVLFGLLVARIEHGGVSTDPAHELNMIQPVLRGGGHREWNRTLRMKFADRKKLEHTAATVTFRDVRGGRHTTAWPRA